MTFDIRPLPVDERRAFAAIALPDPVSIALYERLGFRGVGCFGEVGYKFGRFRDVAWYERSLTTD